MARNFVLAFGGTGGRCVEALTYLYAARVLQDPAHLLIVDPDTANGNVSTARDQLQRYYALHEALRTPEEGGRVFFSGALNEGAGEESFFWRYPTTYQPFSTLVGVAQQPDSYKNLLHLLYDSDDFDLSFEQGYVGRTHIGSVDLFRTLGNAMGDAAKRAEELEGTGQPASDPLEVFFQRIRSSALRETTNLMVIGSVFGGTGASGIPAVPPLVRGVLPSHLMENLRLGCVQVAPYFSFPGGSDGDPDSSHHPLATQAAWYHYAFTDVGYDMIYLAGAPEPAETSDANRPGGAGQRNRAHYVELAVALAAGDFFEGTDTETSGATQVKACGSRSTDWSGFPHRDALDLRRNLVSFATFCLVHEGFFYEMLRDELHKGYRWHHVLQRNSGLRLGGGEDELEQLQEFSARFLNWASDVEASSDATLFQIPDERRAAPARALGRINPGGPPDVDAYHQLLYELNRVNGNNRTSGPGWFVDALTQAVDRFCTSHYASWWRDHE